jgi:lauroyl/myristoyl acyltransferase
MEAVDRPQAANLPAAEAGSLTMRLYTTPSIHRLVPGTAAVRLAHRVGRSRWDDQGRREHALGWAASILGPAADHEAVVELARRSLCEQAVKQELFWRPWRARRSRVEGIEPLLAMHREGRGAIIAYPHLSEHTLLMLAIASNGPRLFLPRNRAPNVDRIASGYSGARRRELLQRMERTGSRWVGRGDAFRVLSALLERGEVVMIAVDVTGRRSSTYLGHRVNLASGPADLAVATGVPAFPSYAYRAGRKLRYVIEEPADPRDLGSADALHHHLVARAEHAVAGRLAELYPFLTGQLRSDFKAERKRRRRADKAR